MIHEPQQIAEAVKAAPPFTVAGLALCGVPLQDWVFILTLVYLALQIGYFVFTKIVIKIVARKRKE